MIKYRLLRIMVGRIFNDAEGVSRDIMGCTPIGLFCALLYICSIIICFVGCVTIINYLLGI